MAKNDNSKNDIPVITDRNLALEAVRVTEAAALAASRLMGRGDEKAADQAAVDAMRAALNRLAIDGEVVIGEGERDEAPMLYIGEQLGRRENEEGTASPEVDIAVDPLEGTNLVATGQSNAITASAFWPPLAVIVVPSSGSSAMSMAGPLPVPTFSPM